MNIMRTGRKHNGAEERIMDGKPGNKIQIYTDGGCHGNPGPGGWAFIVSDGKQSAEESGFEAETTNNRMELKAVIRALEYAGRKWGCGEGTGTEIEIFTDSQYVQKGISEWIIAWEKNSWKTAAKKPVKNKDLWVRLKELSDSCRPVWNWVRGHAGTEKKRKMRLFSAKNNKNP